MFDDAGKTAQQKKTFSSKSVTGKTGQLCVEARTQSSIMFKNKLKMDYRCKVRPENIPPSE